MSDLFHEDIPDGFIADVFEVMQQASWHTFQVLTKRHERLAALAPELPWPANVWMGVSVESDRYAFRADHLRRTDAAVRFLSVEPLLGAVPRLTFDSLDWVIVGGESGGGARPLELEWVRDVRDRAAAAGAAVFIKQLGSRWARSVGTAGKGHDLDAWPEDLRVREMPERRPVTA